MSLKQFIGVIIIVALVLYTLWFIWCISKQVKKQKCTFTQLKEDIKWGFVKFVGFIITIVKFFKPKKDKTPENKKEK